MGKSLSDILRENPQDLSARPPGPERYIVGRGVRPTADRARILALIGGASLMASLGVWVGALLRGHH